jgi:hypothetical protein
MYAIVILHFQLHRVFVSKTYINTTFHLLLTFVLKCNRTLSAKMDYPIFIFHSDSGNCPGNGEFHFCTKSKIDNLFFGQLIFHLPKKEPILLSSDYIQLSEKTFFQCTGIFHTNEPNYQQSANSIYQDKGRFSCQRRMMNTIDKKFDVTLHQKLAQSSGFIQCVCVFLSSGYEGGYC